MIDLENNGIDGSWRLSRRDWLFMAVLAMFAFAMFLPSLHYELTNWDDDEYIRYNPWIWNLSWENVRGVFVHPYFHNYHPLTMLVYMAVYSNFGDSPEPFRLVNLLLHAGTVSLLYALFRALGSRRDVALLVAAFFAVHPLRVESVVWVSELKDVLCGFFYLLALNFWVRGGNLKSSVNRFHAAATASAILAMLAKSMATTLPVVMLVHDILMDRPRLVRRLPVHGLLFLLSIGCMRMNLATQDSAINKDMSRAGALAMALYSPVHHLNKTLVPIGLCPIYAVEDRPSQHAGGVVVGVVVCAVALGAVAMNLRKRQVVSFALLASAISLAPVSMIIPIGSAWAADRYSYIPTALLLCGVAWLTSDYLNSQPARVKVVRSTWGIVIVLMCVATLRYMPVWRSSMSVSERILERFPEQSSGVINKVRAGGGRKPAHPMPMDEETKAEFLLLRQRMWYGDGLYGSELIEAGRVDEGLQAMRSMPFEAAGLHLAACHAELLGRHDEAMRDARALIALGEAGGATAKQLVQVADVLTRNGNLEEAAAVIDSIDTPVYYLDVACGRLAEKYLEAGDPPKAEHYARRALRVHPANETALRVLVEILVGRQESQEAASVLGKALRHPMISEETNRFAESTLNDVGQSR